MRSWAPADDSAGKKRISDAPGGSDHHRESGNTNRSYRDCDDDPFNSTVLARVSIAKYSPARICRSSNTRSRPVVALRNTIGDEPPHGPNTRNTGYASIVPSLTTVRDPIGVDSGYSRSNSRSYSRPSSSPSPPGNAVATWSSTDSNTPDGTR